MFPMNDYAALALGVACAGIGGRIQEEYRKNTRIQRIQKEYRDNPHILQVVKIGSAPIKLDSSLCCGIERLTRTPDFVITR